MRRYVILSLVLLFCLGLPLGVDLHDRGAGLFGILVGVAFAASFVLGFWLSEKWFAARFRDRNPCEEGETLLRQGPAGHFRFMESRGGWLYLTDKRLLWSSHGFNIQNQEVSIALEDVISVRVSLTCWMIPNGLQVKTNNKIDKFIVVDRRAWAAAIMQAKAAQLNN